MAKPSWLKIRPPTTEKFSAVKNIISEKKLHTVCQEGHCPNTSECWSCGTATFLVMGDICTRGCQFCAVATGKPFPLDPDEPTHLASAVKELKIFDYIVLTSVDRDDLDDLGSGHFAACIRALKQQNPGLAVEVLIPDFQGKIDCLKTVVDAGPEVVSHNIETVERLQNIRDRRANYAQSLRVLENVKKLNSSILTKSSLMVGLGETKEEVVQAMQDLRAIDVDFLAIGQYLQPKNKSLEVKEYISPEQFKQYEEQALALGFKYCAAGPFVRTSYRAGDYWITKHLKKNTTDV